MRSSAEVRSSVAVLVGGVLLAAGGLALPVWFAVFPRPFPWSFIWLVTGVAIGIGLLAIQARQSGAGVVWALTVVAVALTLRLEPSGALPVLIPGVAFLTFGAILIVTVGKPAQGTRSHS